MPFFVDRGIDAGRRIWRGAWRQLQSVLVTEGMLLKRFEAVIQKGVVRSRFFFSEFRKGSPI